MFITQPTYRSDLSGVVCAYGFAPHGPGRDLPTEEAREWLEGARAAPQFVWLHFDLSNVGAEKWMRAHLDLPESFFEALHDGTRTTRIELADDALVAVLNDVLHDFAFDAAHVSTLWVCVTHRLLVTARRKPLRSIDPLRVSVRNGDPFRSTVDMLEHLLSDQGDVLVGIVRKATASVDEIEDSLLAGRLEAKRSDLGALRRVMVRLGRLLAPEPPALFRLLNRPPPWMEDADGQALRQASEEFSTVLTDMTVIAERIKLLQEEVAAGINEQNNRSLFLLTVFTVLALPINIIAGLFGMNVGGIPLAQNEHGFWLVVGVVATLTIVAVWILVRRRRD
jgi:zinc transporter